MTSTADDDKCQPSLVDLFLNDPTKLNVLDQSAAVHDDDDNDIVDWDLENDSYFNTLLNMGDDNTPFDFLSSNDDFMSSEATTPRSYDNSVSSSYSDSGLSSVYHMPLISNSDFSTSDEIETKMEFSNDSLISEEIVEESVVCENNIIGDFCSKEDTPTIIKQQPLLKTPSRPVVITSVRSKDPIVISKHLQKPDFTPNNLSYLQKNKIIDQNGKPMDDKHDKRLQFIHNGRKIILRNNNSNVSKSIPILEQNKEVMSNCTSDKSDYVYPSLNLTKEEKILMKQEGINLPTHYPLTKNEQRDLERIRRKIKNRVSAKMTRKRKKVYVEDLEERFKQCSDENIQLMEMVHSLQTENESLKSDLNLLQNTTAPGGTTTVTETCLLALSMSLALIAASYLKPTVTNENDLMFIEDQESNTAVPVPNKDHMDHIYIGTSMEDYYIPELDDEELQSRCRCRASYSRI